MKHKLIIAAGITLSVIKVLLAVFMMVVGIFTAFYLPLDPSLGFLFSHRWTVFVFGVIFFGSGLTLFLGKVLHKRKWTGYGLAAIAGCFFFSALLNASAYGWTPDAWLFNFIAAVLTAGLWLWWKYKVRLAEYQELRQHAVRLGIRS